MATTLFGMFRGARQDDPLASVKAITAWAAGLPANDPLGALEAVVRLLEDASAAQPAATLSRVQALQALDRLTLPIQAEILAQHRLPSLSEDVRRRLWHAANDLARWLAYAYEQAGGVAPAREGERKPPQLAAPGIFSRLFYYRGLQARLGLLHYESWIPGNWKILHSAYREACAQGVATQPFAPGGPAEPGDGCSAEQEYLQILLLQRVNSGNLTANQLEWAGQWLRTWARMLKLSEPPAEGDGYWLDSGRGEGLLAKRPGEPEGELLYLDVRPLHEQVGTLIALLREQVAQSAGHPVQRTHEEQLALARRLDQLWRPQAQPRARRGERRAEKRPVVVAAGWTAMIAAMRTAGAHRQHEPHRYTYDDATSLAVRGYVRSVERDQFGNVIERALNRHGWQLQDTSDSGARILSATRVAQQQQVGALLALQPDGETRWRLCIVRRLRRRTSENTELGVEIIAQNAMMTMVTPLATRASGYSVNGIDTASGNPGFHALYLPPQQYTHGTPVHSLVLPASEFAPGRRLWVRADGAPREIRLFVLLEQGTDWVWTSFEVQDAAKPA
ncbi:MAG: hypothetical protein IPO58_17575 [Betaproteobacteria bacterium]|nr:hypothetical protein [Betaproteobacteria bacterium]